MVEKYQISDSFTNGFSAFAKSELQARDLSIQRKNERVWTRS
jgi:hypothetical protein